MTGGEGERAVVVRIGKCELRHEGWRITVVREKGVRMRGKGTNVGIFCSADGYQAEGQERSLLPTAPQGG